MSRPFDMADAIARLAGETGADALELPVIAIAWATVETERAVRELEPYGPFEAAPNEILLGASCVLGRAGDLALAILEPNIDSRLAAALARYGEGPVALWVSGSLPPDVGLQQSASADGPFGRERLVLGGRIGSHHLLVIEQPAGTIER